jgi:signal transduction histidine kinase
MRLGLKLTLSFLAVGLAGVALIALLASRNTQREFEDFVFNQYRSGYSEQLADYYESQGSWAGVESLPPLREVFPAELGREPRPGGSLTVTDAAGVVLIPGFGRERGEVVGAGQLSGGEPIRVDGETVGWVVRETQPLPPSPAERDFVNRIRRMLVEGALGAVGLSLILGAVLARALSRPIRDLTTATRGVANGNFEQKVPIRSDDELGELAQSFNLMSAELARSLALRRQMTADIAHELRTPISIVLGHAEAIHDGVLPITTEIFEVIRDEALRLERLVEDLRTLSLADGGEMTLTPEPTAPLALLVQASKAHRPQAEQKDIVLTSEADPGLPEVMVDPDRMAQVLGNLIENSLRHTPSGGRVRLAATEAEGAVRIRVEDTGPGIDKEDLPRVFERLYRTDKSRQRDGAGSGLGLAIARSIVVGHGGKIWAESEPGAGATIIIELPVGVEQSA